MASGIKVTDNVKLIFEKMKVHKCDEQTDERPRIVTFTIQNEEIEVDKVICECDLTDCDAFEKFRSLLKDDDCFYLLYDCHYKNKEGICKKEIIFGSWIPDSVVVKARMRYASSRNSIKTMMKGLKHDFQMNDGAVYRNRQDFSDQLDKNNIVELEGKPLNC